jgi:hypothetical protein
VLWGADRGDGREEGGVKGRWKAPGWTGDGSSVPAWRLSRFPAN